MLSKSRRASDNSGEPLGLGRFGKLRIVNVARFTIEINYKNELVSFCGYLTED